MDVSLVGKLISKLRKEKGLTQQELGDMLGVSYKTVSKWECGNGLPDITMLKKISEILGISIEELLDGNLNNKNSIDKDIVNKKKKNIIWILGFLVILVIGISILFLYKDDVDKIDDDRCTVIRSYYIDSIGKSNDENYLYITVHEFQIEGTFTIKMPIIISKNLEVGKSYEFTFKTSKEYIDVTTDYLFDNSQVINLEYTDKEGLERIRESYCNKEEK